MASMNNQSVYDRPIEIADHIYWVGFHDVTSNLHCNPYLIIEGDQAVLIDGGSRSDFADVMMKILQTGISPNQIVALIYHHTDPDLCSSMSNLIDICENPKLMILSESRNNTFLSFYIEREHRTLLRSIDEFSNGFTLAGRTLQFFKTPYAHEAGSFVTYDPKTKTLFSSDLFGSFSSQWELYVDLMDGCHSCIDYDHCIYQRKSCPMLEILKFHARIMPSEKSLRYAMDVIRKLDVDRIAPQHGSIFRNKVDIDVLIERLGGLNGVGMDRIL